MTSKDQERVHCSLKELFVVVLEKGILFNKISSFGVNFELCNLADLFYAQTLHSKVEKVKKKKKNHNRAPLRYIMS